MVKKYSTITWTEKKSLFSKLSNLILLDIFFFKLFTNKFYYSNQQIGLKEIKKKLVKFLRLIIVDFIQS